MCMGKLEGIAVKQMSWDQLENGFSIAHVTEPIVLVRIEPKWHQDCQGHGSGERTIQ